MCSKLKLNQDRHKGHLWEDRDATFNALRRLRHIVSLAGGGGAGHRCGAAGGELEHAEGLQGRRPDS